MMAPGAAVGERLNEIFPELDLERHLNTDFTALVGRDRVRRALLHGLIAEVVRDGGPDLRAAVRTPGDLLAWQSGDRNQAAHAVGDRLEWALKTMRSRTATLRTITPSDLPLLYDSAIDPRFSWRWRYRGYTPSFQEFSSGLWANANAQFLVVRQADDAVIGHVLAYNMRLESGVAEFALARVSPVDVQGPEMMEGLFLFLGYCFRAWPLRKLSAEIPGFNWPQFAGAEELILEVEGVRRQHDFFDGRYWDQRVVSIFRDAFYREAREGVVGRLFLADPPASDDE